MSDNRDKSPADILGYYLIIFQTTFTGYVKCWIDGNENYTYMTEDDFIGLFYKVNAPFNLIIDAKDSITTSSIFLWDIDNERISRLFNISEVESLRKDINKLNPLKNELRRQPRLVSIWGDFISKVTGKHLPKSPDDKK